MVNNDGDSQPLMNVRSMVEATFFRGWKSFTYTIIIKTRSFFFSVPWLSDGRVIQFHRTGPVTGSLTVRIKMQSKATPKSARVAPSVKSSPWKKIDWRFLEKPSRSLIIDLRPATIITFVSTMSWNCRMKLIGIVLIFRFSEL